MKTGRTISTIAILLFGFLSILPIDTAQANTDKSSKKKLSKKKLRKKKKRSKRSKLLSKKRLLKSKKADNLDQYDISAKFGLTYDSIDNESDKSQMAGGAITTKVVGNLSSNFMFLAEGGARFQNGREQGSLSSSNQGAGLFVNEAYLKLGPEWLFAKAGAISQDFLGSQLLIASGPFPGAVVGTEYKNKMFTIGLMGETAIPTSNSLHSERIEKEEDPSFKAAKVYAAIRPNKLIEFSGLITAFEFTNLPSKVAYESSLWGNTVNVNGEENSQFAFEYAGYLFGGEASFDIYNHKLKLGLQQLTNTQAIKSFDSAGLVYTEFIFDFGGQKLVPRAEIFYNESDASVAYYNSPAYGHNNVEGRSIGLDYIFENYGYKMGLKYVETTPVNKNLLQSYEQAIFLNFETLWMDLI